MPMRGGDKPTCIDTNGSLYWFVGPGLFRPGGKPALICVTGTQVRDIMGVHTYTVVTHPDFRLAFIRLVLQT